MLRMQLVIGPAVQGDSQGRADKSGSPSTCLVFKVTRPNERGESGCSFVWTVPTLRECWWFWLLSSERLLLLILLSYNSDFCIHIT